MNEIKKRVKSAQQRLWIGRLGRNLIWSLVICFSICLIAIVVPKIWAIDFLADETLASDWTLYWLIGSGAAAIVGAVLWTWLKRPDQMDAAIEVDLRFNLKERLSSALVLDHRQRETEAGQALLGDAQRRAETLDIRDQFGFRVNRWVLVPICLILVTIGLSFLNNSVSEAVANEKKNKLAERKIVKTSIEEAKKKIAEQMKKFDQKGLEELKPTAEFIERKLDKLQRNDLSKKDALIEINNIQKEIEERQKKLGDTKSLRKQMGKLSAPNDGVAKDFAESMKKGDFKKAQDALKKIADKLAKGKLSEKQQKQLAKQMNQMAKQMKQINAQQQQKKQDLQRKLDQATKNGNLDKAAQLQQQLDQMNKQSKQSQQMQKMAQNLQNCANCMNGNKQQQSKNGQKQSQNGKQGNQSQQAQNNNNQQKNGNQSSNNQQQSQSSQQTQGQQMTQQQMQQMQQQMQQMQQMLQQMSQQMQQSQALQDLAQQMSQCKGQCQGQGQGQGKAGKKPGNSDFAKGRGPGGGQRGLEKDKTGTFKSQVKTNTQKGETVVTGAVDGPNRAGPSRMQAKEMIKKNMKRNFDSLENQQIPKEDETHVKEYMNRLRGGK